MTDHPEHPRPAAAPAAGPDEAAGPPTAGTGPAALAATDEAAGEERAKERSRELARLLATPEGARTARLLQFQGALALPSPSLRLPAGAGPDLQRGELTGARGAAGAAGSTTRGGQPPSQPRP